MQSLGNYKNKTQHKKCILVKQKEFFTMVCRLHKTVVAKDPLELLQQKKHFCINKKVLMLKLYSQTTLPTMS